MHKRLKHCVESIRKITDFKPEIAIVLGSGLGDFAETVKIIHIIDYKDIEGFPVPTVKGHRGRFVFGYANKTPVVIMQGRVHFYEGYSSSQVVLPIRIMGMLGAKKLILTNAAGGICEEFSPGDLMLITDHICLAPSPLIGPNIEELGQRFPDMSEVYSKRLNAVALKSAEKCGITLKSGVYLQLTGPNYETPAEVKMCKILGADAVGMSTACEAVAAKHMGLEICGISCITNLAAGISKGALNHSEVQEIANSVGDKFKELLYEIIVSA